MSIENGVDILTNQMSVMNITNSRRPTNGHMLYISLRDTTETLLPFDGKNMPVLQFANIVLMREIYFLQPRNGLVQMIKNKLVEPALRVVLSGEYNDINSLLAILKTRFAPVYSSSQLHGELAKVT